MRVKIILRAVITICAMFLFIAAGPSANAQEIYTGTVIGVGGTLGGVSRSFTLRIDRYTSNAEASRALAVLAEGGQDRLLRELEGKRLGNFSLGGRLGRDINFVNETRAADGRRRITILFARWMNLYELRYGTRSQDYPFSYIEMFIDANGKGEGTFIPAAKIYFDKKNGNQLDVENFGIYPARLTGVRLHKS